MFPKKERIWVLILLVGLVMLLGACSNSNEHGANQPQNLNDNAASTNSEVEPVLPEPVTIQHLKGEMTFENVPERIVVLDVQYTDHLLALGKQPVGSVVAQTDNALPAYLGDKLDNVKLIGTYEEPNLEATLELEPDLIIATEFHDKIYEDLLKIAPTLTLERNENWQSVLLKFGQFLNQPEEAQQLVDGYKQKVSDLKAELTDKMKEQSVALIRPRDKMIRLHTTSHRTAQILYDELGLTPPQMAADNTDTSTMISIEVLPELDADHLFLLQDDTNRELTAEFQNTAIWKNLSAVTANQVYIENTAQWIGYYGPLAIDLVVDQIAEELN